MGNAESLRESEFLNKTAVFLRLFVWKRLSMYIWRLIAKLYGGYSYFSKVIILGNSFFFGGICGVTNDNLFDNLEGVEPETHLVLKKILREIETPVIMDVGALSGQSILKFKAIQPRAVIHSFDPHPKLVPFIIRMCEKNGWNDVFVNRGAVTDKKGMFKIYYNPKVLSSSSTVKNFQPFYNDYYECESIIMDEYYRDKNLKVHLLKVDVEGGELEVIRGAQQLLKEQKPYILIEFLYTVNPEHLARQKELIAILKSLGYFFYHITEQGILSLQEVVAPDPSYRALNYFLSVKPITS